MKKAVIVDDETDVRQVVRTLLEKHCPDVQVVAEAGNLADAEEAIRTWSPDLVFLDVELDKGTGFDLLETMEDPSFGVIFITAYSEYAVTAFKFSAIDYILKPVDAGDLVQAVEKATKMGQMATKLGTLLDNLQKQQQKVVLNVSDALHVLPVSDILRLESDRNYTIFHLRDGRNLMVAKTLKEYDQMLSAYDFIRIHQSHLVNLSEIRSYIKRSGSVELTDGTVLPVATRKREAVVRRIDQ